MPWTALGITGWHQPHRAEAIRDNDRIALIEIGNRMGETVSAPIWCPSPPGWILSSVPSTWPMGNPWTWPGPRRKDRAGHGAVCAGAPGPGCSGWAEAEHPDWLVEKSEMAPFDHQVEDSGSRYGYFCPALWPGESLALSAREDRPMPKSGTPPRPLIGPAPAAGGRPPMCAAKPLRALLYEFSLSFLLWACLGGYTPSARSR